MIDPGTIGSLIGAVLKVKAGLDAGAMKAEVQRIRGAVDDLGRHLAATTKAELLAGLDNLQHAMTMTDSHVRDDELRAARGRFGSLAGRPDDDPVLETYGDLSTTHVRALAHLGNHYYFLLRDEPKYALIHGYRCAEEYPALAVEILPVAMFSRNWHVEGERTRQLREVSATATADALAAGSTAARRAWGWDMAWRVPAAAGVFLAGLAGAVINPPVIVAGAHGAMGILDGAKEGVLPPRKFDRLAYLAAAGRTQDAFAPVIAEARDRRLAVEAALGRSR